MHQNRRRQVPLLWVGARMITQLSNPKTMATIESVKGMWAIVLRGKMPAKELMYEGYIKANGFMWTPASSSQIDRLLETMNNREIGATNETFSQIVSMYNKMR
jgi:hypothetical protein